MSAGATGRTHKSCGRWPADKQAGYHLVLVLTLRAIPERGLADAERPAS